MVIYIDLIIILNFTIDFILLLSVDNFLKRKTKINRLLISSLIGSISTILLFYINDNLTLNLYKITISIIMITVAFKYESFNYFKDNLIWLYIISIIIGGTIYLIENSITLSNNGLVFSKNPIKVNLILLLLLIPLIIHKYIKNTNKHLKTYSNYYDIIIYYSDVKLSGTAFLDTGNNLKDPILNLPIILVNKDLIKQNIKTRFVSYFTISGSGYIPVFKPKKVIVNGELAKKNLIGLSNINLDGIKIILNKEILWKK